MFIVMFAVSQKWQEEKILLILSNTPYQNIAACVSIPV